MPVRDPSGATFVRAQRGVPSQAHEVGHGGGADAPATLPTSTTPAADANGVGTADVFDHLQGIPPGTLKPPAPSSEPNKRGTPPWLAHAGQLDDELGLPAGHSEEVRTAAQHLWEVYSDPISRFMLACVVDEPAFDVNIDLKPDEQRLGDLMGAIPLADEPAQTVPPPLGVAVLHVPTGADRTVRNPLQLFRAGVSEAGDADVIIAPEWLFLQSNPPLGRAEFEATVAAVVELSRGSDRLLVPGSIGWVDEHGAYRNTAIAVANGEVLKVYDKRHEGDDDELANKLGARFARGSTDARFSWRGLEVGLEICRDHGDATLRWDLEGESRRSVDLHLVVSAGVDVKHPAVGVGGVMIVANGEAHAERHAVVGRRVPRTADDHPTLTRIDEQPPSTTRRVGRGARLQTFTV